jgi:AP-1 complex subunit gamma-1
MLQRIKDLIAAHKTSVDVEIQQRACEYSKLFGFGSNVTNKLLERIPVIEEKQETLKPIETSAGSGLYLWWLR